MGDRRRRHSVYEVIHFSPRIEEREPQTITSLPRRNRRVTIEETRVHRRYGQRQDRSRSRSRTRYRYRVPTPSPPRLSRLPSPPPRRSTFIMSSNDTSTNKAFVPLPKILPTKKDEDKAKKERPSVKILGNGHKKSNSFDTIYTPGTSSPWSLEDRSPFDYSPGPKSKSQSPKPKSPRPTADREVYEVINGQTVVRKYPSKKGDVQYITRKPRTPKDDAVVLSTEVFNDGYKDRYKEVKAAAKELERALIDETEKAHYNHDAALQQEAQRLVEIEALQAQIRKLRLEKRISDSKAAEAEKKFKLSEIERLEDKERELQRREREFELEKKQWKEIGAAPSPSLARRPTLPPLISNTKPDRRNVSLPTYTSGVVTTQPPQTLISGNAGLEAIFEAQRDNDRQKAQELREPRDPRDQTADFVTRTPARETGRNDRDYRRPRRGDRHK